MRSVLGILALILLAGLPIATRATENSESLCVGDAEGTYTVSGPKQTVAPSNYGWWLNTSYFGANWTAPAGHSAQDWVGLFAVGAPNDAASLLQKKPVDTTAMQGWVTFQSPVAEGDYECRYFVAGSWTPAAISPVIYISRFRLHYIEEYFEDERWTTKWTTIGTPDQIGEKDTPKCCTRSIQLVGAATPGIDEAIEQAATTEKKQNPSLLFRLGSILQTPGSYVIAEWYDGSDWHELTRIRREDPANDKKLHAYTFDLPAGAENNPKFKLRFALYGNSAEDKAYIDQIYGAGQPLPTEDGSDKWVARPQKAIPAGTISLLAPSEAEPSILLLGNLFEANVSVFWTAPVGHPASDWIGMFRLGAPSDQANLIERHSLDSTATSGAVTFKLPLERWAKYEFRYFSKDRWTPAAASNTMYMAPLHLMIFLDTFDDAEWVSRWQITRIPDFYTGATKCCKGAARLQGLPTPGVDEAIERTISTVDKKNTQLAFAIGSEGFASDTAYAAVSWFDGTAWHELTRIKKGDPRNDKGLHRNTFLLPPAADNNPDLKFKVELYGDSIQDKVYFDMMEFLGEEILK